MLKRKYMIIGFLALCLTATLFIGATTNSATTSTQPYDPWYDVNGDGIIDIFDVVKLGIRYGTTGDPTRNVTVTNLPLDEQGNLKVINVPRTKTVTICENKIVAISGEPILLGFVDFNGYTATQIFVKSEDVAGQPTAHSYIIRLYFRANNISAWSPNYINIYEAPYTTYYGNVILAPIIEFYAEQGSGWASITLIAYLASD